MKFVIFGLTISSSWGNGHATLWRGLCRALAAEGQEIVFFEHDVPYHANARDLGELPYGTLVLYPEWEDALPLVRLHLEEADAAIVTSYCPDALAAESAVMASRGLHVFYDLDTPVTLAKLRDGERPDYIGPQRWHRFMGTLIRCFTSPWRRSSGFVWIFPISVRSPKTGSNPCNAC